MTVLVPCRDATVDETPTTAKRLTKNADAAGWATRVTYAHAQVGDKDIVSVVVRLRHGALAAVGAWHNNKFELAYVWSKFSPPRRVGSRELAAFVKAVQP